MTNEELKSALAYGINLCELTKTTQVHISLNAAVEILAALDNQAPYQEDKIPDHGDYCLATLHKDAIELLKAQELPPVKPEKLEERTAKWLDNMTAEERLKEIAAILDDWDGYRTAKGLGMLINEVWAYALYPVKTRESVKWIKISPAGIYECSECGKNVMTSDIEAYKYCHGCGKKVKWE